jgi:SPP1 gp7 family putative phage head morphogenesis protein
VATYAESVAIRADFLRRLGDLESGAISEMLRAYSVAIERIEQDMLKALEADTPHGRAIAEVFDGAEDTQRIAVIRGRAEAIAEEFSRFGVHGLAAVKSLAPNAYRLGIENADDQIRSLNARFTKPNKRQVEQTVARLQARTAAAEYLDGFAITSTQQAVDTMTAGVILGERPDKIARRLRDHIKTTGRARLQTFVHTETLGAARAGIADSFRENADILNGWVWNAEESAQTCEVCWAMNGTEHSLDEDLDSHPNCRCVQSPITKSFEELAGMDGWDAEDIPETGARPFDPDERFNAVLSDAEKIKVLGAGKYALYRDGKIRLADLVTPTFSERWGRGLRATTLRELREAGVEAAPIIEQVAASAAREATIGSWLDELAEVRGIRNRDLVRDIAERGKQAVMDDILRVGQIIDDEAQRRLDNFGLADEIMQLERKRDAAKEARSRASTDFFDAQDELKRLDKKRKSAQTRIRNKHTDSSGYLDNAYWDEWNAYRDKVDAEIRAVHAKQEKARADYLDSDRIYSEAQQGLRDTQGRIYLDVLEESGVEFGGATFDLARTAPRSAGDNLPRRGIELQNALDEGQRLAWGVSRWIPRRWIEASNAYRIPLNILSSNRRGFYRNREGLLVGDNDATMVHELMHRAEYTSDRARLMESLFYEYRTRGGSFDGDQDPLERLMDQPGYDWAKSHEVFRRDEFTVPYFGRWYEDSAYELLSMGWGNGIYGGDYTLDAEYRRWLMAVMISG